MAELSLQQCRNLPGGDHALNHDDASAFLQQLDPAVTGLSINGFICVEKINAAQKL